MFPTTIQNDLNALGGIRRINEIATSAYQACVDNALNAAVWKAAAQWPSQKALAEHLGLSEPTVHRIVGDNPAQYLWRMKRRRGEEVLLALGIILEEVYPNRKEILRWIAEATLDERARIRESRANTKSRPLLRDEDLEAVLELADRLERQFDISPLSDGETSLDLFPIFSAAMQWLAEHRKLEKREEIAEAAVFWATAKSVLKYPLAVLIWLHFTEERGQAAEQPQEKHTTRRRWLHLPTRWRPTISDGQYHLTEISPCMSQGQVELRNRAIVLPAGASISYQLPMPIEQLAIVSSCKPTGGTGTLRIEYPNSSLEWSTTISDVAQTARWYPDGARELTLHFAAEHPETRLAISDLIAIPCEDLHSEFIHLSDVEQALQHVSSGFNFKSEWIFSNGGVITCDLTDLPFVVSRFQANAFLKESKSGMVYFEFDSKRFSRPVGVDCETVGLYTQCTRLFVHAKARKRLRMGFESSRRHDTDKLVLWDARLLGSLKSTESQQRTRYS